MMQALALVCGVLHRSHLIIHCQELLKRFDLGLGINSMEGREQKHQQISKYSNNTTVQERWSYIFRHEFIQLIYLRDNGFDMFCYRKRHVKYVPAILEGHCKCSLKLINSKCELCDCDEMQLTISTVEEAMR